MFQGQAGCSRRPRVCISTPTRGWIRAETADWRDRAFVQLAPHVELQTVLDTRPLQHARCVQVVWFLASSCTHIFLLDADCEPQDRTIQKLLAHDLPFVAAPHSTVKGHEVGLMVLDRDGKGAYVQHKPLTGLQGPNVVVGCAGMLIRRDVFEELGPPWFRCVYDERGLLVKTEDFELCDRAYEAGIGVWADCDLFQTHIVVRPI